MKQLEENKKSFILGIEIINGTLTNIQNQGFKEDRNKGFEFFDIKNEIDKISEPLKGESLGKAYVEMRREQINKARTLKFGKRDLKWVMRRLNYYSVCARAKSIFMKKRYKKIAQKFK